MTHIESAKSRKAKRSYSVSLSSRKTFKHEIVNDGMIFDDDEARRVFDATLAEEVRDRRHSLAGYDACALTQYSDAGVEVLAYVVLRQFVADFTIRRT